MSGRETKNASKKSLDTVMSSRKDLSRTLVDASKIEQSSSPSKEVLYSPFKEKQVGPASIHFNVSPTHKNSSESKEM